MCNKFASITSQKEVIQALSIINCLAEPSRFGESEEKFVKSLRGACMETRVSLFCQS